LVAYAATESQKLQQNQQYEKLRKTGTPVANKSSNGEATKRGAAAEKEKEKTMNGLINLPKLGDVGTFCMLAVVAYSVSSLVYVLASGFFGGGAA
jgi:hypothetical protein